MRGAVALGQVERVGGVGQRGEIPCLFLTGAVAKVIITLEGRIYTEAK